MLLLPVLTTGESWPAVAYILCYRPADAGLVLWLRWAGRTNCDMTVIVVAGYSVPTGTDLAHPPPGWACTGTLAAAAVHLEPGALPQRWQVFLSADAAPAPWAPGPQPQALPDSRILVLRSCRTGPELSPRSPGKGEGWGCGSDFVLVPVVNKGVSSSCSPRETASFPRPHCAEARATVLSHPAPPPGAQKAEWGGHWRMARGNECGMGVPSLVGQSEALWGTRVDGAFKQPVSPPGLACGQPKQPSPRPGAWRGEAMVAGARARCAPWQLFVRPVGLEMTELEGPQTLT